MVSRGGRSKGCSNCRRRRVKCDEARPMCNRCKKRGLDCDGPKDATWIDESKSFPLSPPEGGQLVRSTLPMHLSLAGFEDDICLSYTRKNLLRGGLVDIACGMIQFNNGFREQPGRPEVSLLRDSILSLAVTFFGSQHRQQKIEERGYRQYGSVLRKLNSHLAQPHLQTTDETILTTLTCMLLEIFLPTGPNNFMAHMKGLESILEARGPPVAPSGNTAVIFHGLRTLTIVGGLAMSRPALYSRDEWKQIPCLKDSDNEAALLRHRIFGILADCTRIMGERDAVLSTERSENRELLIAESKSLLDGLQAIHADWVSFNDRELGEPAAKPGHQIRFAHYSSVTTYMTYLLGKICLYEVLESLEHSSRYASLRNSAAVDIMRCLELKQHEQHQGAPESNTIGFVATKVAWQALGGFHSPEGRKLAKMVKSAVKGVFAVGAWEEKPVKHSTLLQNWNPQNEATARGFGLLEGVNESLGQPAQGETIDMGESLFAIDGPRLTLAQWQASW